MKTFTLIQILSFFIVLYSFGQNPKLMHPLVNISANYIAISPDKNLVALASNSGIIFLDSKTGKLVKKLNIDKATSIAFSNDNKYIAFTYKNTIQVVDLYSDETIMKNEEQKKCYSIIFSPNDNEIAYYTGKKLKTWNFSNGQFWLVETSENKHYCYMESGVQSDKIRYSPDGNFLLSAPNRNCSPNASAVIWDTKSKTKIKTFDSKNYPNFDINSSWLEIAVLTEDNEILIKDFKTLITKKTIQLTEKLNFIKYHPNNDTLFVTNINSFNNSPVYLINIVSEEIISKASINADKIMILDKNLLLTYKLYRGFKTYNILNGSLKEFPNIFAKNIEKIGLSENQEIIYIISFNNDLRLVDNSFNYLNTYPDYYKSYGGVSIPKEGNIVITCGGDDLNIWDFKTGEILKAFMDIFEVDREKIFSDNGKRLFEYQREGYEFSYFDVNTGNKLYDFKSKYFGEDPGIYSGAFSHDNRYFATGANTRYDLTRTWDQGSRELPKEEQKRIVDIWDLKTGNKLKEFETSHPEGIIQDIAFSNDNKFIFTTSNNEEKTLMWDFGGKQIRAFKGRLKRISTDDQYLLTNLKTETGFNTVVYNILTGDRVNSIPVGGDAYISKDSKYIYTVLGNSHIEVWSVQSGKLEFSYYIVNKSDWVAITPEGFYDGTKKGISEIHYVKDFQIIPIDTLNDSNYKPGIIESILK